MSEEVNALEWDNIPSQMDRELQLQQLLSRGWQGEQVELIDSQ